MSIQSLIPMAQVAVGATLVAAGAFAGCIAGGRGYEIGNNLFGTPSRTDFLARPTPTDRMVTATAVGVLTAVGAKVFVSFGMATLGVENRVVVGAVLAGVSLIGVVRGRILALRRAEEVREMDRHNQEALTQQNNQENTLRTALPNLFM